MQNWWVSFRRLSLSPFPLYHFQHDETARPSRRVTINQHISKFLSGCIHLGASKGPQRVNASPQGTDLLVWMRVGLEYDKDIFQGSHNWCPRDRNE